MIDLKLLAALPVLLPVVTLAGGQTPQLLWALIGSILGAYCLAAVEVVAMLMGQPLPDTARKMWRALAILRISIGIPLGLFGALYYAAKNPDAHEWVVGALAYFIGWSGLALKPILDKLLHRRIEQMTLPAVSGALEKHP